MSRPSYSGGRNSGGVCQTVVRIGIGSAADSDGSRGGRRAVTRLCARHQVSGRRPVPFLWMGRCQTEDSIHSIRSFIISVKLVQSVSYRCKHHSCIIPFDYRTVWGEALVVVINVWPSASTPCWIKNVPPPVWVNCPEVTCCFKDDDYSIVSIMIDKNFVDSF